LYVSLWTSERWKLGLSRYLNGFLGWMIVAVIVVQGLVEWTAQSWLKAPLVVGVILLVLMMVVGARGAGRVFAVVCALLTAALVLTRSDWPEVLWGAVINVGFLASFFSSLTILRNAASTSDAMAGAGTYLSEQPPGRRYLSLTVGTQVFALLLNFGAIQLLASLALASVKTEQDQEVRAIRTRRMLLAIHRGFISALPWSPMSFSTAIAVATIPGTTWTQIAVPGLVSSAIILVTGWALDTIVKPKMSGNRPPPLRSSYRWTALLPLGALLLIMLVPIFLIEETLGIRIAGIVLVLVPGISIVWLWFQMRDWAALGRRLTTYVRTELPNYKNDLLLIMSAGYMGVVGASLLSPALSSAGIDLSVIPVWLLLLALLWIMPIMGQLGANPILTMSLVAPLLPPATGLGIPPAAFAVALLCGWAMTGLTSPFTATNLLIGRFGSIRTIDVGWVWNRTYFLITVTLLSIWALVYAFWFGG